jgi:hypothetical protein
MKKGEAMKKVMGYISSVFVLVMMVPVPSAGNTIVSVDTTGIVGWETSMAIGADGLPVISYFDQTNKNLKVAKCGNAPCSSGNTITTVDATDNVGLYTSIAIGADGLPVISYYDNTNLDLKFVKCGNASFGEHTSIAIGTGNLPVISYYDWSHGDLKVATYETDNIGVFRDRWWHLDSNGILGWNEGDTSLQFGKPTDKPVTGDGDGDGDGTMNVGVFRDRWWYLDSNGTPGWNECDTSIRFGKSDDIPVTGNW